MAVDAGGAGGGRQLLARFDGSVDGTTAPAAGGSGFRVRGDLIDRDHAVGIEDGEFVGLAGGTECGGLGMVEAAGRQVLDGAALATEGAPFIRGHEDDLILTEEDAEGGLESLGEWDSLFPIGPPKNGAGLVHGDDAGPSEGRRLDERDHRRGELVGITAAGRMNEIQSIVVGDGDPFFHGSQKEAVTGEIGWGGRREFGDVDSLLHVPGVGEADEDGSTGGIPIGAPAGVSAQGDGNGVSREPGWRAGDAGDVIVPVQSGHGFLGEGFAVGAGDEQRIGAIAHPSDDENAVVMPDPTTAPTDFLQGAGPQTPDDEDFRPGASDGKEPRPIGKEVSPGSRPGQPDTTEELGGELGRATAGGEEGPGVVAASLKAKEEMAVGVASEETILRRETDEGVDQGARLVQGEGGLGESAPDEHADEVSGLVAYAWIGIGAGDGNKVLGEWCDECWGWSGGCQSTEAFQGIEMAAEVGAALEGCGEATDGLVRAGPGGIEHGEGFVGAVEGVGEDFGGAEWVAGAEALVRFPAERGLGGLGVAEALVEFRQLKPASELLEAFDGFVDVPAGGEATCSLERIVELGFVENRGLFEMAALFQGVGGRGEVPEQMGIDVCGPAEATQPQLPVGQFAVTELENLEQIRRHIPGIERAARKRAELEVDRVRWKGGSRRCG